MNTNNNKPNKNNQGSLLIQCRLQSEPPLWEKSLNTSTNVTTCSTLGLISWWFTKEWRDNWSIFGQAPSVTDLGPNIFFILTLLSPTYFVVTFLDLQTRYIYLAYISKFAVSFKSNWILTLLKLSTHLKFKIELSFKIAKLSARYTVSNSLVLH